MNDEKPDDDPALWDVTKYRSNSRRIIYLDRQEGRRSQAALTPQTDRELAEMIAKFRTPPGMSWADLADDIETALRSRRHLSSDFSPEAQLRSTPLARPEETTSFVPLEALKEDALPVPTSFAGGYIFRCVAGQLVSDRLPDIE